jgi:hypothetical protein
MGNTSSARSSIRSSFRRHSAVRSTRSVVQRNDDNWRYTEQTTNPKWEGADAHAAAVDADTDLTFGRFAHSGSILFVEGDSDMASYQANACRDLLDGGWGLPAFADENEVGDENVGRVSSGSVVESDEALHDPNQKEPQWLDSIVLDEGQDEEKCCEHEDCPYSGRGHPEAGRDASGSIVEFEVEPNAEAENEEEWLENVGVSDHGCCDDENCNYAPTEGVQAEGDHSGHHHHTHGASTLEESLPHARESRDYASESVFEYKFNDNTRGVEWFDKVGADEGACCADGEECSYSAGYHDHVNDSKDHLQSNYIGWGSDMSLFGCGQSDVEDEVTDNRRWSQDQAAAAAVFGVVASASTTRVSASESVVEDYTVQHQKHVPAWVDNVGDVCGMCEGSDKNCAYSFH